MTVPTQPVTGLSTWAGELACPVCFSALHASTEQLTCTACSRTYPITSGIPVLIPNRATTSSLE